MYVYVFVGRRDGRSVQYSLRWDIFSSSQALGTHCDGGPKDPMVWSPVPAPSRASDSFLTSPGCRR